MIFFINPTNLFPYLDLTEKVFIINLTKFFFCFVLVFYPNLTKLQPHDKDLILVSLVSFNNSVMLGVIFNRPTSVIQVRMCCIRLHWQNV